MKNWNTAVIGKIVYIRDPIDVWEKDNYSHSNGFTEPVKFTPPFQKAMIDNITNDYIVVSVIDGDFDGYEFYFYYHRCTPDELLTIGEFEEWAADYEKDADNMSISVNFSPIDETDSSSDNKDKEIISLLEGIKVFAEHKEKEEYPNAWSPRLIQKAIDIIKGEKG